MARCMPSSRYMPALLSTPAPHLAASGVLKAAAAFIILLALLPGLTGVVCRQEGRQIGTQALQW